MLRENPEECLLRERGRDDTDGPGWAPVEAITSLRCEAISGECLLRERGRDDTERPGWATVEAITTLRCESISGEWQLEILKL